MDHQVINKFNSLASNELDRVVHLILGYIHKGWHVTFEGDLGAGKTHLVSLIMERLGYQDETSSPTFSLVNEYPVDSGMIYHMDLYRIGSFEELLDIGMEDYLERGVCLIEWPELALPLLDNGVQVLIEHRDEGRDYTICKLGEGGDEVAIID